MPGLYAAGRAHVNQALEAISSVLNRVSKHYKHGTISFGLVGNLGDAESLLYVIRDGLDAEEARRERGSGC